MDGFLVKRRFHDLAGVGKVKQLGPSSETLTILSSIPTSTIFNTNIVSPANAVVWREVQQRIYRCSTWMGPTTLHYLAMASTFNRPELGIPLSDVTIDWYLLIISVTLHEMSILAYCGGNSALPDLILLVGYGWFWMWETEGYIESCVRGIKFA